MTTALETNVLVALWNEDDTLNLRAQEVLDEAHLRGRMVVSGVVYAELLAERQRDETFVDQFCDSAGIEIESECHFPNSKSLPSESMDKAGLIGFGMLTLATANTTEFGGVDRLMWEGWAREVQVDDKCGSKG